MLEIIKEISNTESLRNKMNEICESILKAKWNYKCRLFNLKKLIIIILISIATACKHKVRCPLRQRSIWVHELMSEIPGQYKSQILVLHTQ